MRTLFAIMFILCGAVPAPARQTPGDATVRTDDVVIRTADVERFWQAYDRFEAPGSRADSLRALFEAYYLPASPGLEAFIRSRIGSVYDLLDQIRTHPRYYASIRESTLRAASFEAEIRDDLHRFRVLYPEAELPDVYFVIGRMNSGGTTSPRRILIGTEMYGRTPSMPPTSAPRTSGRRSVTS